MKDLQMTVYPKKANGKDKSKSWCVYVSLRPGTGYIRQFSSEAVARAHAILLWDKLAETGDAMERPQLTSEQQERLKKVAR